MLKAEIFNQKTNAVLAGKQEALETERHAEAEKERKLEEDSRKLAHTKYTEILWKIDDRSNIGEFFLEEIVAFAIDPDHIPTAAWYFVHELGEICRLDGFDFNIVNQDFYGSDESPRMLNFGYRISWGKGFR